MTYPGKLYSNKNMSLLNCAEYFLSIHIPHLIALMNSIKTINHISLLKSRESKIASSHFNIGLQATLT